MELGAEDNSGRSIDIGWPTSKNWDSNDSRDRGPEIDSDDAKSCGVDRLTDWSSDGVGDKEVEDETSRGIA